MRIPKTRLEQFPCLSCAICPASQPRRCLFKSKKLQGKKFGDHLISSSTNSSEGLEEMISPHRCGRETSQIQGTPAWQKLWLPCEMHRLHHHAPCLLLARNAAQRQLLQMHSKVKSKFQLPAAKTFRNDSMPLWSSRLCTVVRPPEYW